MDHHSPAQNPKQTFIGQLQQMCQLMASCKDDPDFPGKTAHSSCRKKQPRASRTRSKSLQKVKVPPSSPTRKSKRIDAHSAHEKLFEIYREPLWNARKRKSDSVLRIPILPQLRELGKPESTAITKPDSPIYEFYSEEDMRTVQVPKTRQKRISSRAAHQTRKNMKMNSINSESHTKITDSNTPLTALQYDHNLQLFPPIPEEGPREDENCAPPQMITQREIEQWSPNKSEMQLLRIQQVLDQYFLFKEEFRTGRTIELQEMIRFVRDIQGYFFDRARFDKLCMLNPNLYKLFRVENNWLVKCPSLREADIAARLTTTKTAMIRLSRMAGLQ